jgi:hypothetical protein
LAEEDLAAFVEVFQDWTGSILPRAEVSARRISRLYIPGPATLADCTSPRALAFGITAEIHSSPDRTRTRTWAAAFARAGFDGMRFFVRHDPAQRRVGIALFGPAGEAAWPVASTDEVSTDLLGRAHAIFGIQVR